MFDTDKVLAKMDKAAHRAEKMEFSCKNCGSQYFNQTGTWLECKHCKYLCNKEAYVKKEEEVKVETPKAVEYHVIKGPHTICTPYGMKGFTIPLGKFAIARVGISQERKTDMIAALTILFDDKSIADKLALAMRVRVLEDVKPSNVMLDESYEPKNIEPFEHKEEVFDYGIIELTEVLDEPFRDILPARIVMFACGDCLSHRTINTKYDKNFKIKEPCGRCGKLIKAEIVG